MVMGVALIRFCALFSFFSIYLIADQQYNIENFSRRVIISINVDASSNEMVRESLRLLTSIQLFGGSLRYSRIHICLAHDEYSDVKSVLKKLNHFNVSHIQLSHRYSLPSQSPSLNKLCCFEPKDLSDDMYLLYLDSDFFVARDPLPLLQFLIDQLKNRNQGLLCGRPWDTFPDMVLFEDFVFGSHPNFEYGHNSIINISSEKRPSGVNITHSTSTWRKVDKSDGGNWRPLMETYNGGYTYFGMCNTGMYFMSGGVAKKLVSSAKHYLTRATNHPFFNKVFRTKHFGIDSIVLWSAQFYLDLEIIICPPSLNFMVPIEKQMERFKDSDDVYLFHFSRGSDLFFDLIPPLQGEETGVSECVVHLSGISSSKSPSLVETFFRNQFIIDSQTSLSLLLTYSDVSACSMLNSLTDTEGISFPDISVPSINYDIEQGSIQSATVNQFPQRQSQDHGGDLCYRYNVNFLNSSFAEQNTTVNLDKFSCHISFPNVIPFIVDSMGWVSLDLMLICSCQQLAQNGWQIIDACSDNNFVEISVATHDGINNPATTALVPSQLVVNRVENDDIGKKWQWISTIHYKPEIIDSFYENGIGVTDSYDWKNPSTALSTSIILKYNLESKVQTEKSFFACFDLGLHIFYRY
jgi:hypothetical protein